VSLAKKFKSSRIAVMARNLSQWTTRIPSISGSKFNYSLDHSLPGIRINVRNVILIEMVVDGPKDAMNG
jgi:hypothetical protein